MAGRNNEHLRAHYVPHVERARQRLDSDEGMARLLDPSTDPSVILAFLIEFSALGVQMTEPVEGWIRGAGERCLELGLTRLGRVLGEHAKHEAGHHRMMINDLHALCLRWESLGKPALDRERLVCQPPTDAMKRYFQIHEDTIASDHPYGQLAIELEIERMSTVLGPLLLGVCREALGQDVLAEMSFISDHTELDVGHTAMNEAELDRFLAERPELGPTLAEIGGRALHIYLDFLGDCEAAGRRLLATPLTLAG